MKKLMVMVLTGAMVFSLAACGAKDEPAQSSTPSSTIESSVESTVESTVESSEAESTEAESSENGGEDTPAVEATGAAAILSQVWNAHGENEKFAIFGGTMTDPVMDAPGAFDIADTESLNSMLGYPAEEVSKIDDAASVMHMMNANTFTAGAYHVANDADIDAVAAALKNNILSRQWICGCPDVVVVAKSGNYVVAMFGNREIVTTFQEKMAEALPDTVIISSDDI